ncbi:MAG: zinc ribbon domain-containing protein, partial [Gammaproteobacteria bacterium]|nr:zinc ribbon domain-containing protein [Gammaproteobacteria bacterium]
MFITIPCSECGNEIQPPAERCPHCGRPGYFWNVITAMEPAEREALERRYQTAKRDATSRGADGPLQDFENAIAGSKAVIARSEGEVLRLATSTRQLYSTYYQQIEAGVRLPDGDAWDMLRELADTVLFPNYKKEMRFGALSWDGVGLSNYGSCSIVLRDELISYRTSVFEENSALFMERHDIKISRDPNLPKGYRATWGDRAKLCVAKLSLRIDSTTNSDKYSKLLLLKGATSKDDEFVEVHIWGPMTVLTME